MKRIIDKPSPFTGGRLELCTEPSTVEYRGETISYEKSFYHCVDTNMEYADEELETANLKRIYDTYRRRHGIPTAEELKQMRVRYGIPSSAMSIILGLGENQYGLYEEGTVPALSVGRLLALAMDPANMKDMLQAARYSLTDKQFGKYYAALASTLHPARYETNGLCLTDYSFFPSFPSSQKSMKPRYSTCRRSSYYEYYYAPVSR